MISNKFKILVKDAEIGNSKIGGKPDLRENSVYPINENGFYEFIAQLNFEEIKGTSELLPQQGMIYCLLGQFIKVNIILSIMKKCQAIFNE